MIRINSMFKLPRICLKPMMISRRTFYPKQGDNDPEIEDYVDYKPAPKPRLPKYDVSPEQFEKGRTGAFEIEELVKYLRHQNMRDFFVCEVSPSLRYVDHIVICSGLSNRHNSKIAESIRFLYKKKMADSSPDLSGVSGDTNGKWVAMDLGNIVLHIMSPETREFYDLESLWAVGPDLSAASLHFEST